MHRPATTHNKQQEAQEKNFFLEFVRLFISFSPLDFWIDCISFSHWKKKSRLDYFVSTFFDLLWQYKFQWIWRNPGAFFVCRIKRWISKSSGKAFLAKNQWIIGVFTFAERALIKKKKSAKHFKKFKKLYGQVSRWRLNGTYYMFLVPLVEKVIFVPWTPWFSLSDTVSTLWQSPRVEKLASGENNGVRGTKLLYLRPSQW